MMRIGSGIFTLFFLLSGKVLMPLEGQELSDSTAYDQGIYLIQRSKSLTDYTQAAGYFEDLSKQKPDQWLTYYYAALCYIHASYRTDADDAKDAWLDRAQPLIDKAFQLRPRESEIMVLQAFLYQSRIQVKPEMRGLSYSSKADASLKKAAAADEKNPRAWSLMGYNTYHTPVLFGGGPKKALPLFLKARDNYMIFKPILPFYPHWGGEENQQMVSRCKKELK
jgi:hypothetical protein